MGDFPPNKPPGALERFFGFLLLDLTTHQADKNRSVAHILRNFGIYHSHMANPGILQARDNSAELAQKKFADTVNSIRRGHWYSAGFHGVTEHLHPHVLLDEIYCF